MCLIPGESALRSITFTLLISDLSIYCCYFGMTFCVYFLCGACTDTRFESFSPWICWMASGWSLLSCLSSYELTLLQSSSSCVNWWFVK